MKLCNTGTSYNRIVTEMITSHLMTDTLMKVIITCKTFNLSHVPMMDSDIKLSISYIILPCMTSKNLMRSMQKRLGSMVRIISTHKHHTTTQSESKGRINLESTLASD